MATTRSSVLKQITELEIVLERLQTEVDEKRDKYREGTEGEELWTLVGEHIELATEAMTNARNDLDE
jgi:hypothetical protein